MFRFQKNDRYTSIAIYAFLVLAAAILAVDLLINLPWIAGEFSALLSMLSPIFIGFAIAYICAPIVNFTERTLLPHLKKRSRRFTRVLSLVLTYLVVLLFIGIVILMIVPQIVFNYQELVDGLNSLLSALGERIEALLRDIGLVGENSDTLGNLIGEGGFSGAILTILTFVTGQLAVIGANLLAGIGNTLFGIILSAYFLYYKDILVSILKKAMLALFPYKIYEKVTDTLAFTDRAFGRFIVSRLFEAVIVGLISFITLAIIGMPFYPLVSAIVGLTNLIPVFGPLIGAVPSFFIILLKDPWMAFWFVIFAIALQQVDANFVGPKIVGSVTGLPSVWVITAIMLFGTYFGLLGWFIGVPLFSVLYRLIGDFASRRLQKKGRPTELRYYETTTITQIGRDEGAPARIPESGAPAPQAVPAPADGKEEDREKMDE